MRPNGDALIGSATDVSNSLSCCHLTVLEMAVARSKRQRAALARPVGVPTEKARAKG